MTTRKPQEQQHLTSATLRSTAPTVTTPGPISAEARAVLTGCGEALQRWPAARFDAYANLGGIQ